MQYVMSKTTMVVPVEALLVGGDLHDIHFAST